MNNTYDTVIEFIQMWDVHLENFCYWWYMPMLEARWRAISNYIEFVYLARPEIILFTPNEWLRMFIEFGGILVVAAAVVAYFFTVVARITGNPASGRDTLLTSYAYYDEWEEELGSLDDALFYALLFAVIIVWFYFFTIIAALLVAKNINWLLSLFTVVLISGIIIPSSVVKHMGLQFVQYVRGSGRSTSLVFETLLDLISTSVIVIRFLIQNIRFVFVFFAFFELYEFIFNKLDVIFSSLNVMAVTWTGLWRSQYSDWYCYEIVAQLFLQWFTYLYYLGHLTLLFVVQLSIYFILSFWLFFFLYTTFLSQPHEKYFFYARHN